MLQKKIFGPVRAYRDEMMNEIYNWVNWDLTSNCALLAVTESIDGRWLANDVIVVTLETANELRFTPLPETSEPVRFLLMIVKIEDLDPYRFYDMDDPFEQVLYAALPQLAIEAALAA